MEHGHLHSLIPITDFKAILGLDDREDCLDFASVRNQGYEFSQSKNSTHLFQPPSLAAFCLTTATFTIEQYCKRRLLRKKRFEFLPFYGDYIQGPNTFFCNNNFSWPHAMPHYSENRLTGSPALLGVLRDYPVREILAIYQTHALKEAIIVEPDFYHTIPDCGEPENIPFCLSVSPARGLDDFFVNRELTEPHAVPHYSSIRSTFRVHYRAWNMSRYRGPPPRSGFFIGMTGAVRGIGKDGEHLEASMPENVRLLLEPYRRRTI